MDLEFSTISEQTNKKFDVPIAPDVNIEELTKGDKDPMFVTIEALNDSKASRNNNYYDIKTLQSIAEQVNKLKPDAFQGHLEDKDRPYKNPESQTIWIGAKIFNIDGVNRLFIKGYVLPSAKQRRSYLKAAKAAGKAVFVSIYGRAKQLYDKAIQASRVVDIRLESIDWARAGGAGIDTLGFVNITREMADDEVTVSEYYNMYIDNKIYGLRYDVKNYVKDKIISEMSGKSYSKENIDNVYAKILSSGDVKSIINKKEINPQRLQTTEHGRKFTKIVNK